MEALLAALQAAVGAVAFLTGFASLRLHSQRDRALQRADAIYRELTAPTSAARVEDQNVELTSTALTDALHLDPVGVWTLWTSGGISVVSAGLVGVVGWRLHWHFSPNPAGWDPSFPSLIAMVAFSTVIALLGLADYKWVQGDLRRRDRKSYMEQVRSAIALRREGKPALALSTAEQLSADLHQWAWLYAFRSNCLEQLGRIHEAIPLARTACDLAPENGWWRLQLARLYWESGQGRDASEAINAALEKLPKESSALTLRGILRERERRLGGGAGGS